MKIFNSISDFNNFLIRNLEYKSKENNKFPILY